MKETKIWHVDEGYLFPFLRPSNAQFQLQKSTEENIEVRTMGAVVEEASGNAIGSSFFFKFQVIARHRHKTSEIPLYANGMRLSLDDNTASIWLKDQDSIQIVVQGSRPSVLWKEILDFIEQTQYNYRGMMLNIFMLCPRCIVEMIELSYANNPQSKYTELPPQALTAKFSRKELENEAKVVNCGSHVIDKIALTEGYFQKITTPKYTAKHLHVTLDGDLKVKKAENINIKNLFNK